MSSATSKTVLQVVPRLVMGGVERGTVDIAKALVGAGWRSIVASAGGQMVRELERSGAEHIQIPLDERNPFAIRKNAARLRALIDEKKVDIVHARSRAPAWSAKIAIEGTPASFVTTFHGVYGFGPFGLKKRYNRVMTQGDVVIAVSEFIRNHIVKEYSVPPERVRLIHRGVDLSLFNAARVSPDRIVQLTSKWRLPDAAPVIMLPGRLTRIKGHHVLVDALAELARRNSGSLDIRCLMVGKSDGRSAYARSVLDYAAARGVGGNVHIIDDCNDIPAAYMATDVVVSATTRPEAFGRTVAEAQAMGRPVVAPAQGPAGEILVSGVTGWLFTPSDPVSLADALNRALRLTQEERAKLASIATARVQELFDNTDMRAKTLAVYNEVLAQKGNAHRSSQ
ncbi:MAG: glycosyltransferase family 4 protein [Rhodospirillaceae bacterium]